MRRGSYLADHHSWREPRWNVEALEDRFPLTAEVALDVLIGPMRDGLISPETAVMGLNSPQGDAAVVALSDGSHLATLVDTLPSGESAIFVRRTDSDGLPGAAPTLVAKVSLGRAGTSSDIRVAAAPLPASESLVFWMTPFSLHGIHLDANGQVIGSSFTIPEATPGPTQPIAAAAWFDGQVLVSWRDEQTNAIVAATIDSEGTLLQGPVILHATTADRSIDELRLIARPDGGAMLQWSERLVADPLHVAWMYASVDTDLTLSSLVEFAPQPILELPDLAVLSNDLVAVVYQEPTGPPATGLVELRGNDGQLQKRITIESPILAPMESLHLCPLPNVGFLVTFASYDGARRMLQSQTFNLDGEQFGGGAAIHSMELPSGADSRPIAVDANTVAIYWQGLAFDGIHPVIWQRTWEWASFPLVIDVVDPIGSFIPSDYYLTISNLPDDVGLNHGTLIGPGVWRLAWSDLSDLNVVRSVAFLPLQIQVDLIEASTDSVSARFSMTLGTPHDDLIPAGLMTLLVDGQEGNDTIIFGEPTNAYQLQQTTSQQYVLQRVIDGSEHWLYGIEQLAFADHTWGLDELFDAQVPVDGQPLPPPDLNPPTEDPTIPDIPLPDDDTSPDLEEPIEDDELPLPDLELPPLDDVSSAIDNWTDGDWSDSDSYTDDDWSDDDPWSSDDTSSSWDDTWDDAADQLGTDDDYGFDGDSQWSPDQQFEDVSDWSTTGNTWTEPTSQPAPVDNTNADSSTEEVSAPSTPVATADGQPTLNEEVAATAQVEGQMMGKPTTMASSAGSPDWQLAPTTTLPIAQRLGSDYPNRSAQPPSFARDIGAWTTSPSFATSSIVAATADSNAEPTALPAPPPASFHTDRLPVATRFDVGQLFSNVDNVLEEVVVAQERQALVAGTAIVVATGFSVAQIAWLLRGSLLITKTLSSLPIWIGFDPLPVLGEVPEPLRGEAHDPDDSLLDMVRTSS